MPWSALKALVLISNSTNAHENKDLLDLLSYCALTKTNRTLGILPENPDPQVKIEHNSLAARTKHHMIAKIQTARVKQIARRILQITCPYTARAGVAACASRPDYE